MRKILLSVFVGFLVIGGLVYVFVPLSSAAEICSAIEPWGVGDTNTAQLNRPMGLAWTDGFLYLADTENGEIKKFAEDGSLVARWPGFKRLVAVAVMGDTVYVADFLTDRITKLWVDGTVIAWWGRSGNGDGAFDAPSGIAVDRKGNVYVADFYNHRIQKFSGSGELLGKLGSRPSSDRQLQYPAGVAADPTGRIYVSDFFANRIWKAKCDGPG